MMMQDQLEAGKKLFAQSLLAESAVCFEEAVLASALWGQFEVHHGDDVDVNAVLSS